MKHKGKNCSEQSENANITHNSGSSFNRGVEIQRRELCLPEPKGNSFKVPEPAITIVFSCHRIAQKYQEKMQQFLKSILTDGDDFSCSCSDDQEDVHVQEQQHVMNGNGTPQIPLYDSIFDDTLEYGEKYEESITQAESQKMTCFNCLGDHHLNECPQEHNASRIAANRRQIMENSQNTVRYHTDDAQPLEKSGSLYPGHISDSLRHALDLKTNQLPLYIYHMRILGYPPGWMKEAEIEHSGLSVYDSNGNVVEDEGNEDMSSKRFNGENFISYPGFNAPLPSGCIDEWKQLRMMPMQAHQQLSEALKHSCVSKLPNYKKRKSVSIEDFGNTGKKSKTDDQDVEPSKTESTDEVHSSNETPQKEKQKDNNTIASIVPGSPLIDTGNPFKILPDCSKFSADITEHLPFENLPDSVGAYDKKMRGVLDQVRQDMTRLQGEEK